MALCVDCVVEPLLTHLLQVYARTLGKDQQLQKFVRQFCTMWADYLRNGICNNTLGDASIQPPEESLLSTNVTGR